MSQYPDDLKYQDSHEYVRLDGDIATIGITEFAARELGEIVFVELPEIGQLFAKGDELGTIESVKAVGEVFSPVTGTVVEINPVVADDPELLNDDPYGEGWLLKIRVDDPSELDDALTASQYSALVEGQE
ncbi:glycine cleavage system protein GcvH [Nostoc sp. FACHB-87]|uniref:glycine cleavage system protein GcvH n=1 Tax=Nostocales TaxID=1161 RepID=UPI00168A2BA0|nr:MULTISPECIES: glycine cleavage system protein GcvH [Nostocales]MBD2297835.1 glycine cleavage system protein GcvH [Nostoc sp. FACHB-190]MBD2454887.1 glycine cleavage system protein GcvH [Nostoc sp. FACHB-87]MBD2476655.1 glycine cleavage system protein GcvH [Anabaena sp. FACHB-83]MBD2487595.1 glycine cleavage system protein GcvH [Aulosira sp. FACHB-615]